MPVTVAPPQAVGRYRWRICALLFFATTINYVDRQVLALLAPMLQTSIHMSELQYGNIVFTFQLAYALGLLMMGRVIDRIGTRIGYALAIGLWSLAAMSHSLVSTVFGFSVVRFLLGLGESGNFPAAIKTVSEWFPRRERALATGIFNSGSNVGATLAPLTVPWIAVTLGWRWAFVFTGIFSATWIVVWLRTYRAPEHHPGVTPAELLHIRSETIELQPTIGWGKLLPHRQTWAILIAKFMTDPIWWFFLFWLPKYFFSQHGLSLTKLGLPLIVIYNFAAVGSVGGGWLAKVLLRRGWSLNAARKTTMLACALLVMPVVFVGHVTGTWSAIALVSLACAGHQGWSANLFTMVSDVFPTSAVGSVTGIGGFGGAVGGMLIARGTGMLLQATHNYTSLFVLAGSVYIVALLIIQLLIPKLQPLELKP